MERPAHITVNVSGNMRVSDEPREWDAFICHASEDKENFVGPLAKELNRREVRVWYDAFTLKVGDSLRREIDRGLRDSRFGIVVLSPAFFEKQWPQYELDGLVQREIDGKKVILPVWHGVTREEVTHYSPSLAGRYAANSSEGLQAVVDKLVEAIRAPVAEKNAPKLAARGELTPRDDWDRSHPRALRAITIGLVILILILLLPVANSLRSLYLVTQAPERERTPPSGVQTPTRPQSSPPPRTRVDPAVKKNWRAHLQNGMSRDDVRGLFGEPTDVSVVGDLEVWKYGDGEIEFQNGSLYAWTEPSSDQTQPFSSAPGDQGSRPKKGPQARPLPKLPDIQLPVDSRDRANWRKYLRIGMTAKELARLFGQADRISTWGDRQDWHYGHGWITLEGGKVSAWSEPM